MSKYDVANVRKRLQDKQGSRFKDPNEFRPPKNTVDETTIRLRFFVLPPLEAGDKCADGVASQSMDLFYVQNGSHWVNNRTHQCPRVHEDDAECPMCQLGFDLMGETDDKDQRRGIAKQFLPRTQYAANVYFPKDKLNPEEVRGKVLWMNASKQVYDIWEACVMNDEAGDPADPQACGVFYDEEGAYLFQLEIKKNKEWNSYTTSKFLASLGKRPIAMKGGKAIPERIEAIMAQRHDLFTKFAARDPEGLGVIAKQMLSGEPEEAADAGFDSDDTQKPKAEKPKAEKPKAEKPKAEKPKAEKPKPKPEPEKPVAEDIEDIEDDIEGALGEDVVTADNNAGGVDGIEDAEGKAESTDDVEDSELQSLLDEIESDDDE